MTREAGDADASPALAVDKVDGLVQNEGSFCTNVTGDVFLRKCYGKRPDRPAKPVDTITYEGDSSPSCILNEVIWVFNGLSGRR